MIADKINAFFEGGLAAMIVLNIRRVLIDKRVAGVSIWTVLFVTLWGYWNLYYYPTLGQWWSFAGGVGVVIGNTVWLALLLRYRK